MLLKGLQTIIDNHHLERNNAQSLRHDKPDCRRSWLRRTEGDQDRRIEVPSACRLAASGSASMRASGTRAETGLRIGVKVSSASVPRVRQHSRPAGSTAVEAARLAIIGSRSGRSRTAYRTLENWNRLVQRGLAPEATNGNSGIRILFPLQRRYSAAGWCCRQRYVPPPSWPGSSA
ncbi:hypothetical protein [Rhodopila globiformis]|uniref:hypothetical protein n=1 Tax=Rhodopila globiformis TaxID=1071 RepID=UPI0011B0BCCB|nr:hypothetical protein [Rhodopila globiformis]